MTDEREEHGPERRDVETGRCRHLTQHQGCAYRCDEPRPCPIHDSRPREATAAEEANLSHTQSPGGSIPIVHGPSKPDVHALLDCLVDSLRNSVWLLADKDYRTSADLLERAADLLQEESEGDRRKAKSKARATCAAQAREETPS